MNRGRQFSGSQNPNSRASQNARFVFSFLLGFFWFFATHAIAQEDWHYNYFKEKRPLTLDADKIAVKKAGKPLVANLHSTLSKLGVVADATDAWPIRGWFVSKGLAKAHPAETRRGLIDKVAREADAEFASPVFVGRNGGPVFLTQDILVGFKPGIRPERADAILNQYGKGSVIDRNFGNMQSVTCYRFRAASRSGCEVLDMANALAGHAEVRFAEPDMIFTGTTCLMPSDPDFADSWGLHNTGQSGGTVDMDMDAPEAWDITTGNSSIIVAVLDTGVQQDHPDLNLVPGADVTDDANSTGDGGPVNGFDNHGTAVAGCISAAMNNSRGSVGIAPGCRVLSIRTFITIDGAGRLHTHTSPTSWTVQALSVAESRGARVSNNSNAYGTADQSAAIETMYQDTKFRGMVHFAAAGNDGLNNFISYPASIPAVNAVAAVDRSGDIADFAGGCVNAAGGSNRGQGLDFSAPGEDIFTTDRTGAAGYNSTDDFTCIDGTSFASPYAAGVAALILARNPSLTASRVEQIMQQSCTDLGAAGYDTTFGYGLVNARQALLVASPSLDSGAVNPTSGNTDGIYTFTVHFTDPYGNAPLQAQVQIDGYPYTMMRTAGTDANGTYSFSKSNLGAGVHSYSFVFFSTSPFVNLILPQPGIYSGPTVSSTNGGSGATNMVSVRWGMFAGAGDTDYREGVGGEVFPVIGGAARFAFGDQLWFTGTPSFEWQIDRWEQRWASPAWVPVNTVSGNSALMVVSGDGHTIRCIFRRQNPNQRILKISVVGPGQVNPTAVYYAYSLNAQAVVVATPQPNARFVRWTLDGADAGSNSTINVTMDGILDKDLRATFAWNNSVEYIVDLPCIADVSVRPSGSIEGDWNAYHDNTEIPVRYRSTPPIYEAFFKFDVSALPADGIVSNVALHAYCRSAPTSWATVEVQKNTGDWSDTVQMTSVPGRTSTSWGRHDRGTGWHVFDLSGVTTQWRDWVQQEWMQGQNFGLRIRPYQEWVDQGNYMNGTFNYYTREHGDSTQRPFVRITYLGRRLVPMIATDKTQIAAVVFQGVAPANQFLAVRNTGEGTLNFTVSDDAAWLNLSGDVTGTSTNEDRQVTLSFDTASLALGTYLGSITIADTNASNSPFVVPVTLIVLLPTLEATRQQGNSLVLSWPTNAVGFNLEASMNLVPPVTWISVLPEPVNSGGNYVVTNSTSGKAKFYRLKK